MGTANACDNSSSKLRKAASKAGENGTNIVQNNRAGAGAFCCAPSIKAVTNWGVGAGNRYVNFVSKHASIFMTSSAIVK
eukprot:2474469-Amphidinium_carterae.1